MPDTNPAPPATGGTEGSPATGDNKGSNPAPATGAAPATPATGATTPAAPTPPETPPLTADEIKELVASNQRMAEALQKANKEAEKRRKDAAEAERTGLSEAEKTAKDLADAKAHEEELLVELATTRVENKVASLTPKLGILNPEVVARLIDWDDLDFDADGRPTNVEDVVNKIVTANPFLVSKAGPTPPTPTGLGASAGTGTGTPPTLTAAELAAAEQANISPERYQALKGVSTLKDWQKTRTPSGQ